MEYSASYILVALFLSRECQNFCIWMAAYRVWISPKKKWSFASCLPLELHMPPDIEENTKQTKNTTTTFCFSQDSNSCCLGLFATSNFVGIQSWTQHSKLKLQNPHLKIDQLIWVWNSLFFWWKSLFFRRDTMKTHKVSLSQRTRTTSERQFVRRWKKTFKKSYRKATQNSLWLCKLERITGIFLQLQVRKN